MVRDSICSHSEFLPRDLNSEFPTLEADICFWVGDTTFLITHLESWLKDDSGSDISPKKKYILGLGLGCEPKSKTKINSEFNSIKFWYRNQQKFKILKTQKFFGLKDVRKI